MVDRLREQLSSENRKTGLSKLVRQFEQVNGAKDKNNTFLLLPQKAIYWKEEQIVLVSDLHIGKIPISQSRYLLYQTMPISWQLPGAFDEIIESTDLKHILFVGDLFHSDVNREWDQFCTYANNIQP